jgi:hypothetical protein
MPTAACFLGILLFSQNLLESDMVLRVYDPSTQEADTGDQELEASLDYISRP